MKTLIHLAMVPSLEPHYPRLTNGKNGKGKCIRRNCPKVRREQCRYSVECKSLSSLRMGFAPEAPRTTKVSVMLVGEHGNHSIGDNDDDDDDEDGDTCVVTSLCSKAPRELFSREMSQE